MALPLPVRSARTTRTHAWPTALVAALALALAGPALAQAPLPGRTVESLLELARERNPEFAAMRHEARAAQERPESAGALPDPMFRTEFMDVTNEGKDASANLLPPRIGGAKYTVIQPLPWFGKRDAKREMAQADADAATSKAEIAWQEVAMRVKSAYAQYYLAVENERLAREVLDLVVRLESVAQARYAGGLAPQQDSIRAQVEQTTLRTDIVMLESDRQRATARLNALVGRPAAAALADPERLRPLPAPARLSAGDLEERARARSPILAAEAARVRAAGKQVEVTDLNRWPDVALGLSPRQTRNRVSEWEVMLEFSIPLQQSSRRAQEREARSMLDAAKSKEEAVAAAALGELGENLAALEAARRTERLADASLLPQAELTFESALAGYENGKVDFATLLDAQRQIRRAKQERLKARAEAQMRLADIERIVGEEL